VPHRRLRWALSLTATAAIAAMFVYVATLPLSADEGANIGAGVLLLWLLVSIGLLGLALAGRQRDSAQRDSARPGSGWAKTGIGTSLFMLLSSDPFLVVVPIVVTAVSWLREPASRPRVVATGLTALVVLYVLLTAVF
jgi:membrane protease YdiL (CAAX protease family)